MAVPVMLVRSMTRGLPLSDGAVIVGGGRRVMACADPEVVPAAGGDSI